MELQNIPALAFLAAVWTMSLTGCTSLFFHPSHTRYPYLEVDRLSAKTVMLQSKDGTEISAWEIDSVLARKNHPEISVPKDLKPGETRGIALQFHGNAENMTTHYRFQLWLLFEGWDVLTFDYRGYGMSGGSTSNLKGIGEDGVAALEWAGKIAKEKNLPLVVFGQSLGASVAVSSLSQTVPEQMKLFVVDSAFYSFTSIAREKLNDVWFLWPFQWLGWLLVSDELSAGPKLEQLKPQAPGAFATPAIFLHSLRDPVVSNRQGEKLFNAYPSEKVRWTTHESGHANTLFAEPSKDIPPKTVYREKMKLKLRELRGSWSRETTEPKAEKPRASK